MCDGVLLLVLPLAGRSAAGMEELLSGLEQGVLSGRLGGVTAAAVPLAAACAAVSLVGVAARYLRGGSFDWWEFVRPLLLFALVCGFPTLVLGPVRGIAGIANTRLAGTVGVSTESFKQLFRERSEQICREEFGPLEEEDAAPGTESGIGGFLRRTGRRLTSVYYGINEKLNLGAASLVAGVMFFLLNLSVSVMVIIANIYLIMMALIGPYTFAVSILHPFRNGVRLWVERYVQYTLWQPLLYCVMYLATEVLALGNRKTTEGGFWTWAFMCVAVFTVIRQVPAFASFVIEGAGTEALANRLSELGGRAVRTVGEAVRTIK